MRFGPEDADLAAAIDQFDRVAANLEKLESVWHQLGELSPADIEFGLDTPERGNLVRTFSHLAEHLPAIDGFRVDAVPESADAIAQTRLDYWEIGEPAGRAAFDRSVEEPGYQIGEYRYRFDRARSALVRSHVTDVTAMIDDVVRDIDAVNGLGEWRGEDRWEELSSLVSQLDRLVGGQVPGKARWAALRRHLSFQDSTDLSDIATMDWPSVRAEVQSILYDQHEPLPVAVEDLADLVNARPVGAVSTRLAWSRLDAEGFERLVFELVRRTAGYENVNWLMKTNAADRGRDIEAYRVVRDPLAGVRRYRVIIQCKHWQERSVGSADLSACIQTIKLWEPPKIDVLIVASTGRFSQDAVAIAERQENERVLPAVELWPESHLETLLSRRPSLAAQFDLR
ncbi:restriction endonuclease [Kitasatospora sp. NPDC101157]|uniref:restriction endonuclease n=1 Tax=Kitasatospora sp. NPDC101157 TaxID=3364098 RepID=UPI0038307D4D